MTSTPGRFAAAMVLSSLAVAPASGQPQCAALNTPVFFVGNGIPASCTQAALQNALDTAGAAGGGRIFFLCGPGPVTIVLRTPLTPPDKTTINGGGLITLAGSSVGEVTVDAGAAVVLKNLSFVGPAVTTSGILTVCNCTFSGPTSLGHRAINNSNTGTLIVADSTFSGLGDFSSSEGSAINNSGTATVNRSTFRGNVARNAGAILNQTGATLDVRNSVFFDNGADAPFGLGGAIQNLGTFTVTNSEFRGNGAGGGGAIHHVAGSLIVRNSTFFNNHASPSGGGILGVADFTVRHSEFLKNSAFHGGGLTIGDSAIATIRRSTVTLNVAVTGGGICVGPMAMVIPDGSVIMSNIGGDIVQPCP